MSRAEHVKIPYTYVFSHILFIKHRRIFFFFFFFIFTHHFNLKFYVSVLFLFTVVRRKTIYEYHRVDFNRQEINNWTAIYLRALPTCLQMENCSDCLTKVPEFECKWCRELNQCSTGTFRFRQDWLAKGCENSSIKNVSSCPANSKSIIEHIDDNSNNNHENNRARVISNGELSASVEPKHLSNELSASDCN